jgi:hypothetical protein
MTAIRSRSAVFCAALSFLSSPSRAQSVCVEPAAPALLDGATATLAQMDAARLAARDFIAKSDDYQNCLTNEMAATNLANDPSHGRNLEKAVDAKIIANQRRKESVGAAINSAIALYKQIHP